jgi:HD-GYP domain-containing protein (c-di-GMP phosphodiesterase class II)
MLKGGVEATAAAAVLHHHQHYDGSGFPILPVKEGDEPRNAGERIHVFARILGVADLYDRLTVGPQGQRRSNIEILHLMRTTYSTWLDPMIMRVVPSVIPPFPPGMVVTLSDGTDAVVVGVRPDRPYQPQVRRIVDPASFKLAADTLDLSVMSGLAIEKIAGQAVAEMIPEPTAGKAAQAA